MSWDGKLHPRYPAGTRGPGGESLGGKFMPKHLAGTPAWVAAVNTQIAKKQVAAPKPAPVPRPVKSSVAAKVQARPASLPFGETASQRERRVLGIVAQNRHLDTSYTQRTGGRWSTARAKMHQQIVSDLMKRHAKVPTDRKAILVGGLIGAGKTTTLSGAAGVNLADYISINSDVVKEEMAKRGMMPSIPGHPDLSPLDHSTLVQQESLHIADMWLARATKRGKNVIFDASMNVAWPTQARIQAFRNQGYGVTGVFIDVPVNVSAVRSTKRYEQDHLDWMGGKGYGGRPIPSHLIIGAKSGNTSVNRLTFNGLRSSFDQWSIYDNSGSAPRLLSSG